MTAAGDLVRQRAVLDAARLRDRHPGWAVRPVRVHGGWSVEAVPDSDDGRASVVIGTAAEVEDTIEEEAAGMLPPPNR